MTILTTLSGNEVYCLFQKGFNPGDSVIGNSLHSLGIRGAISSELNAPLGTELKQITHELKEGRTAAFQRMINEAKSKQGNGIIGITLQLINQLNNIEFLSTGSLVHTNKPNSDKSFFSSRSNGQELYSELDTGYHPISFVFGNVAYSTKMSGGIIGKLKAFTKGEIKKFSDTFNQTRELAIERIKIEAKHHNANAIINIQANTFTYSGVNEMFMSGTAADHPLFASSNEIITSNLSHSEAWSLVQLGYAPMRLLLGTSVFSLGFVSNITSAVKSFFQGEIADLTKLFHDARKASLAIIKDKATELGAEEVIGIKTSVYHLGNGLVEFLAMGTAIKKCPGMKNNSDQLPIQAIITDPKK